MSAIAPTLQSFFTDRLAKQRQASPRTVASFRDSLRLLLIFVKERTGKTPRNLDWGDLDADTVTASSITWSTNGTTAPAPATCA